MPVNFTDFSSFFRYDKSLGKLIRYPLSLIPKNIHVPILTGKMKGLKWLVGASSHGCWIGTVEREKQEALSSNLSAGDVFYDIGGHVGLHTLLGSRLVGESGRVFTFEPFPRNIKILRNHISLNNITNVTLFECAISDREGSVSFQEGGGDSSEGRILDGENDTDAFTVPTISLDMLLERKEIEPPKCIKLDVEGAELLVLKGAKNILSTYKPTIFYATHGDDLTVSCREYLEELGYTVTSLELPSWQEEDEFIATYPS